MDAWQREFIQENTKSEKALPKLSPVQRDFAEKELRNLRALSSKELTEIQRKETSPEWNTYREALDSLSNGSLSRDDTKAQKAQAEWRERHPGEAILAQIIPPAAFMVLSTTAAGRAAMMGSELAGVPAVGRFLTGAAGESGGLGGRLTSMGSGALSGMWQGVLGELAYPSKRDEMGSNILTGLGFGAGGGLLSRLSPLRSHISEEGARLARSAQEQGIPVTTSQVPGAPFAARAMASALGLGRQPNEAYTRQLIASFGGNGSALSQDVIDNARDSLGQVFSGAAAGTGPMAHPAIEQRLRARFQTAFNGLNSEDDRRAAQNLANAVSRAYSKGLTGADYLDLTNKSGAVSDAQRNPGLKALGNDVRDILDDALEGANPIAAQDIRLARNQYRNAFVAEKLLGKESSGAVDSNGIINPRKLGPAIESKYGSSDKASQSAQSALNPVDLGALSDSANFLRTPANRLPHTGATALGTALGVGVGEHMGFLPLIEMAKENPVAALGLAATGIGTGAAGLGLNTQSALNLLLSRAERGNPFIGSTSIPLAEQLYRDRGESTLTPDKAELEGYIRSSAKARGIDPEQAMRVARSEGFNQYTGDEGSSFGPFQLHYGGIARGGNSVPGLGDIFTSATGLDARDPRTVHAQIDFALDHAAKNGWGPWHGWHGEPFAGISRRPALIDAQGNAYFAKPGGQGYEIVQQGGQ